MAAVIDHKSINEAVFASRDYKVKTEKVARKYVEELLTRRKQALISELNRHSITKEIEMGVEAVNISKTLGGYGNLFSFIGFIDGDKPTEKLRILLESISYKTPKYDITSGSWIFNIELPNEKAIIDATPIPWQDGAGWALEIEKGISGLGHYLNTKSIRSRSGGGLEVANKVRVVSESSRMPYITPMLDDFRVNLTRMRG